MNKLTALGFTLLITTLWTTGAQAADFYFFDGGGGDSLWTTPENWTLDRGGNVDPAGYPGEFEPTDVVIAKTGGGKRALIEDGTDILANFITMWGGPDVAPLVKDGFDMTGGTIQLVAPNGAFEIGGNASNIPTEVNMSGGTINAFAGLFIGGRTGGPAPIIVDAVFNMSGGAEATFSGVKLGVDDPATLQSTGALNMSDTAVLTTEGLDIGPMGTGLVTLADSAKIILPGDQAEVMNANVAAGLITGGMATYDAGLDLTTIMAIVDISPDESDFNEDGSRNGPDFIIWQQNNGGAGTPTTGDADGNGTVNGLDLAIWQTQFGTPTPMSLGAAANVPEPATCCLAVITFTLLGHFTSRRIGR